MARNTLIKEQCGPRTIIVAHPCSRMSRIVRMAPYANVTKSAKRRFLKHCLFKIYEIFNRSNIERNYFGKSFKTLQNFFFPKALRSIQQKIVNKNLDVDVEVVVVVEATTLMSFVFEAFAGGVFVRRGFFLNNLSSLC